VDEASGKYSPSKSKQVKCISIQPVHPTWSNVSTQPSQILLSTNHNKVQLAEPRLPGDDDGNGGQAISESTRNKQKP
jgi:hypothetical protein